MTIYLCPNCGNPLKPKLTEGIAFCENCRRTIDSSQRSAALFASWVARKQHIADSATLQSICPNLDSKLIDLIIEKVSIDGYSHQEFEKLLFDIDPL